MKTITLIASGQMNAALTFPLLDNGHHLRLVGSPLDNDIITRLRQDNYHTTLRRNLKEGIDYYTIDEVETALDDTDLVICGVSSFGVDWFMTEIIPIIPQGVPMISVTKGMIVDDEGNMLSYPEYWSSHLPKNSTLDIYAIGGPCTARGLADLDQTTVAFCGQNLEMLKALKDIFSTDYYHIDLSTDVRGVECAVAIKNGYALGVAQAIGLMNRRTDLTEMHYNSQSFLFAQAFKEMSRLLQLAGGRPESLVYGIGDLYVTVNGGRSRKAGILLGEGYTLEEVKQKMKGETIEAIVIAKRTASAVKAQGRLGKIETNDFPLLLEMDAVLSGDQRVDIPWKSFEAIHA